MHNEYDSIFPIDRRSFLPWTARVVSWPIPRGTTELLYVVEFDGPSARRLTLRVPKESLVVEKRQQEVFNDVQRWLTEWNGDGELKSCFS
jgi:hypothetical protein